MYKTQFFVCLFWCGVFLFGVFLFWGVILAIWLLFVSTFFGQREVTTSFAGLLNIVNRLFQIHEHVFKA